MASDKLLNILFLCILLIYICYMFFTRPQVGYIKNIILWLGIFCLLILVYAFRFELSSIKERVIAVLVPSYSWTNNSGQFVIARSSNGHFYLDAVGSKNQVIHFLVDTGASDVALTRQDAIKLGFKLDALNYTRKYNTANGVSYAAPVVIKELIIHKKTFYNVEAHVASEGLDISLLGMSLIEDFANFKITKDMLILEY
ncbi:MAG: TIGR02281 family clan AA aspartic protease [Candidatus Megaira endosymbiont of Carteria cerasiformis]|jgi:aspartyl protease family protein|nr:TIGR02281 family clan AA aspartic protease [Candidatus Megaera polyxenophila]